MNIRVPYSAYLVALVAEASTAAGRLLDLPPEVREPIAGRARAEASRLSARLDGSPLTDETADLVDSGSWTPPAEVLEVQRVGGWAGALRLEGMATEDVAAVEYANLLATHDDEPRIAEYFFDEPLRALAELHALICRGLVDPDVAGRRRLTSQAVHDGAQGRVIYNTPEPEAVPSLLGGLEAWLRGDDQEGSAAYPAPVVAGVVHELLLQWQPYEAANGRLARAASRLVLRARGLDPSALAVPERSWVRDPGGYYGEVAATIRRRGNLGPWVERSTEALAEALTAVVLDAHPAAAEVPHPRAIEAAAAMAPGVTVTVADYAREQGVSRETAWRDLHVLAASGEVERVPGNLGRRFRRR